MKSFLIAILKHFFSFLIAFFLFGCFFLAFTFVLIGLLEKPPVIIKDNSVLVLDLSMNITDSPDNRSFHDFLEDVASAESIQTASLRQILDAIDAAAKDTNIVGILLKGSPISLNYGSGYPVLDEVRSSILEFKKSKKPVVSYLLNADIQDYFLASVADTVVMDPFGQLDVKGLMMEMVYLGDTLKKYGVGVQVTKVGDYKSAVETFTRSNMSEFERQQSTELIEELWGQILGKIGGARGLSTTRLGQLSKQYGLFNPFEAKKLDLIDEVEYGDQVYKHFDIERAKQEKEWSYNKVTLKKYIREVQQKKFLERIKSNKPKIAIVYTEGDIVEGKGRSYQVGGDRLEKTLKEIEEDDEIKAVVLRVNSPGGSAQASEKIQHALRLIQQKEKPIVASFGSYAASGGYWISCYCDTIYSNPMTVTGSIGVFGLIFNIEQIGKSYGVTFDRVLTGPFASINSMSQAKTPEQLGKFQEFTNYIYNAFVYKVAEGRKMEVANVAAIAKGRVWSGLKAKEIGLVDEFGGLKDAIKHAGKLAKIEDDGWELKEYPDSDNIGQEIMEYFNESSKTKETTIKVLQHFVKESDNLLRGLESFNSPRHVYARLPYGLTLR